MNTSLSIVKKDKKINQFWNFSRRGFSFSLHAVERGKT